MASVGSRREARERALELLYESYAKDVPVGMVLADLVVAPDPYAATIVDLVAARADEIDGFITKFAKGWTIDRMPVVDRALLRMAIAELLSDGAPPIGVVISEAIELAKRYSTEESARFINGVLASVANAIAAP